MSVLLICALLALSAMSQTEDMDPTIENSDATWTENSDGTVCCRAMTLECVSCTYGMTEEEFCQEYPEHSLCDTIENSDATWTENSDGTVCCRAMTLECISCQEGMTEEEFCQEYPGDSLCDTIENSDATWIENSDGTLCCRAYTVECLSCNEGMSQEEYCQEYPDHSLCDTTENSDGTVKFTECPLDEAALNSLYLPCEGTFTCQYGQECCCDECSHSFEVTCHDGVLAGFYTDFCFSPSCDSQLICCEAMTLGCLSCKEGMTEEEYCRIYSQFEGCDTTENSDGTETSEAEALETNCYDLPVDATVECLQRRIDSLENRVVDLENLAEKCDRVEDILTSGCSAN